MESSPYVFAREHRRVNESNAIVTKQSPSPPPPSSEPLHQTMAATIPIPRMPPSHSPQYTHHTHPHHLSVSSPPQQSSSSFRPRYVSPTGMTGRSPPSSSSHRPHPYARRTSSSAQSDHLPRIHLPPPNSGAPFKLSDQHSPRDLLAAEMPWRTERDRPQLHRLPSDGKGSGYNLPSLHSMTGPSSGSPTLPPPPSLGPPPIGKRTESGRSSPRMYPPNINVGVSTNPNIRRTSNHFEQRPYSPGSSSSSRYIDHEREREKDRLHELDRQRERERERAEAYGESSHRRHSHSQPHTHHSHAQHYHHQRHTALPTGPPAYSDAPSPPLRALPTTALPSGPSHYPPYPGQLARSRSQSSGSGMSRPGAGTLSSEEGHENFPPHLAMGLNAGIGMGMVGSGREMGPTAGQSRRLAHLMSEQKRRESINSGFQALRGAVPSSQPADSKAIILRKAVAHIAHLETVLRRAGVAWSDSPPVRASEGERELWAEERGDELGDEDRIKWEEER